MNSCGKASFSVARHSTSTGQPGDTSPSRLVALFFFFDLNSLSRRHSSRCPRKAILGSVRRGRLTPSPPTRPPRSRFGFSPKQTTRPNWANVQPKEKEVFSLSIFPVFISNSTYPQTYNRVPEPHQSLLLTPPARFFRLRADSTNLNT